MMGWGGGASGFKTNAVCVCMHVCVHVCVLCGRDNAQVHMTAVCVCVCMVHMTAVCVHMAHAGACTRRVGAGDAGRFGCLRAHRQDDAEGATWREA